MIKVSTFSNIVKSSSLEIQKAHKLFINSPNHDVIAALRKTKIANNCNNPLYMIKSALAYPDKAPGMRFPCQSNFLHCHAVFLGEGEFFAKQ